MDLLPGIGQVLHTSRGNRISYGSFAGRIPRRAFGPFFVGALPVHASGVLRQGLHQSILNLRVRS